LENYEFCRRGHSSGRACRLRNRSAPTPSIHIFPKQQQWRHHLYCQTQMPQREHGPSSCLSSFAARNRQVGQRSTRFHFKQCRSGGHATLVHARSRYRRTGAAGVACKALLERKTQTTGTTALGWTLTFRARAAVGLLCLNERSLGGPLVKSRSCHYRT